MTEAEIIEIMARALVKPEYTWEKLTDEWRGKAVQAATAALNTLKAHSLAILPVEPTEAMQLAGHNMRSDPHTGMETGCGIDEIYTAMIAACLKERETT